MGRKPSSNRARRKAVFLCMFLSSLSPTLSFNCSPHRDCRSSSSLLVRHAKRGEEATATSSRADGVYARPSAAIERGSGFFFPGLEGPKVRLLGGTVLLIMTGVNHLASTTTSAGNRFSEGLAAIFSGFVLFQAAVEYVKESRDIVIVGGSGMTKSTSGAAATTTTYQQQWSMPGDIDSAWRERVEWAATTYLSLTPATHMVLIGPGSMLYWLGTSDPVDSPSTSNVVMACQAAWETAQKSTGGRVSLPLTHPACTGLSLGDTDSLTTHRSVVLQRVSQESQLCWMVTSDQLLASFSRQDLQWLGQLARYIDPK